MCAARDARSPSAAPGRKAAVYPAGGQRLAAQTDEERLPRLRTHIQPVPERLPGGLIERYLAALASLALAHNDLALPLVCSNQGAKACKSFK